MEYKSLAKKIKDYFKDKYEIIAVYLFGSYAMGKAKDRSDIDLGILFQREQIHMAVEERNYYMVELGRILRKNVHPVILNSAGEELLKQIFLKGKCICVNDQHELAQFKMIMLAQIAEFSYYKIPMQRRLITQVMNDKKGGRGG